MKIHAAWRGVFVLAVFLSVAALTALAVPGQNASQKQTAFEVVSIKPVVPNSGPGRPGMSMNAGPGCSISGLQIDARRLTVNAPLLILIAMAHDGTCRVPEMITGVADWMKTERWEIEALMPEGTAKYTPTQFINRVPEINSMIRTMLADRFKVVVHHEKKEGTVTALTVGSRPKLTKAAPEDPSVRRINLRSDQDGKPFREFIAGKANMVALASMIQTATNLQVRDQTGIEGEFNIKFEYDQEGIARPTIYSVLQSELGLKLEPSKETVDVIVVDRAERPSEN